MPAPRLKLETAIERPFVMAIYQGERITQTVVVLDGNEYLDCEFENCRMIYQGGDLPQLQRCHFIRCTWHLEEGALRTVKFLRGIYHSGPGGRELVEDTLKQIRVAQ